MTGSALNSVNGSPSCEADEHCITCGDTATPMRVLELDLERELALCEDADGARATVEIALVLPVLTDDFLLVHAGTGLTNLGSDPVVTR